MENGIIINGKEYELVDVKENEFCCADCDLLKKCDSLCKGDVYDICYIFSDTFQKHFKQITK
jgi:hypothetical protein